MSEQTTQLAAAAAEVPAELARDTRRWVERSERVIYVQLQQPGPETYWRTIARAIRTPDGVWRVRLLYGSLAGLSGTAPTRALARAELARLTDQWRGGL